MLLSLTRLLALLLTGAGLALTPRPAIAQDTPSPGQKIVRLSPEKLESLRLVEVEKAARLYTQQIAFSEQNQRKIRNNLPLAEKEFQAAIKDVRARFQACMESGFEARMKNAFEAQVLRKTIESVVTASVSEPKQAKTIIPAFTVTDAFCSGKIKTWMAGAIQ